jgi:hypothetical protein
MFLRDVGRLNSGNVCHTSVQNRVFSCPSLNRRYLCTPNRVNYYTLARDFENNIMRDELIGGWRKLRNKLHSLHALSNVNY